MLRFEAAHAGATPAARTMGKLSQSYAHNAGARQPDKPRIITYKGQKRKHLYPSGKVERFVNLQGTVVEIPLVPSGVPPTAEAIASARARLHKMKSHDGDIEGFIEHGRCPLRHGTRELSQLLREEFAALPTKLKDEAPVPLAPCPEDPVTWRKGPKGIEYFDSCPHVQAIIESRRDRHKARTEARRFKQKTSLQMEQEKVELMKKQNEATTKILERVADAVAKPKKAPTE